MSALVLLATSLMLSGPVVEAADTDARFGEQPSMNTSCSSGVCSKGTWSMFYGGKTEDQCKSICEDFRKLEPVPTGVIEKVYKFSQNGKFHDVSAKTPIFERGVSQIKYDSTGSYFDEKFKSVNLRDHFYVRWEGYIKVTQPGDYTFWTRSDDGSRLYINDNSVVQNPGWHGMRDRDGKVTLTAGKHKFNAEFFEGGGGAGMILSYRGPDTNGQKVTVPSSVLSSSIEEGQTLLMLPEPSKLLEGGNGLCTAYSHSGDSCIVYTECDEVGQQEQVCERKLQFVDDAAAFTTCVYPAVIQLPPPPPQEQASGAPPSQQAAGGDAAGVDTPGWKNGHGYDCAGYASKGWCKDGGFGPGQEWTGGSKFNYPEKNCAVCGKS